MLELPDVVDLLSLRELAPVIGRLRSRHALNILGMEVLAAADRLKADVFLRRRRLDFKLRWPRKTARADCWRELLLSVH